MLTRLVVLAAVVKVSLGASAASGSTSPSYCHDLIDCSSYKDLCGNTAYTDVMQRQCPVTCGLCKTRDKNCVDVSHKCTSWNKNGFCGSSFYTVSQKREYCALTCSLCSTTNSSQAPQCADFAGFCSGWKGAGFCTSDIYTTQQKRLYCAQTCGLCY